MSDDVVLEKVCTEKHSNIKEQFGVVNKRLDSHSESINEMKEAVIELKGISKMLAEKQTNSRGFGLLVFSSICSPIVVGLIMFLILNK